MSQRSRPSASTAAVQQASSASTSSQGTTCAICLDRMSDRSVAIPCCHEFDYQCISEWAANHSLCPVCRRNMDFIHHNIKSNTEYFVHPVIPQHNDEDDYHDEDSEDDNSDALSNVSDMSDLAGFNIQFGPVMINFANSSGSDSSNDDNNISNHSDDNISDIFGDSSENDGDDANEQGDDDDADDEEEEMDGDDLQLPAENDFQEIENVVDGTSETIDLSSDEDGNTRGNSTVNISDDDDHYDTPSDYGDEPVDIDEEDVYEEANDYNGFDEDGED